MRRVRLNFPQFMGWRRAVVAAGIIILLIVFIQTGSLEVLKNRSNWLKDPCVEDMASAGAKKEILAAGIMVFRLMGQNIEYLLLQASNLNHHWTPPKGKLDPGETDMIAAQRETQEEAGLSPADYDIIPDFQATLEYEAWNKHKRVVYWSARVKNPDVPITLSSEHMDFKWCDLPTVVQMSKGLKDNQIKAYDDLEALLRKKYFMPEPK